MFLSSGEENAPTVPRCSGGWGRRLLDYDLIEVLDLTVAGSEAGYDPWKPRSLIPILTDGVYLGVPSSTRRQKILYSILLLLLILSSPSIHDTHTCFKNIKPRPSGRGKEKGYKGASCSTDSIIPNSPRSPIALPTSEPPLVSWRSPLREDAVGPTADLAGSPWIWSPTRPTDAEPMTVMEDSNIRDSSKRTADSASLDEGGEGVRRSEKAQRAGQRASPYPYRRV